MRGGGARAEARNYLPQDTYTGRVTLQLAREGGRVHPPGQLQQRRLAHTQANFNTALMVSGSKPEAR